MKIIYLQNGMHHKNQHALINYKNIQLFSINKPEDLDKIDLSQYDCVYSPSTPINASKYPNIKFIFGPHFSVFPVEHQMNIIRAPNTVYIQPSEWVVKLWQNNKFCVDIQIKLKPFAVDIDRFCNIRPFTERNLVFVYYKNRAPNDIYFVLSVLEKRGIRGKVFQYGKYNETEYLTYLQQSRYGIWVDAHESQGFALEEALSCNVPLLVWNIKSMNQEYGSSYPDIPASSIPYWDGRCGEMFYNTDEFESTLDLFLSKLEIYKPRDYILENLSPSICEKRFASLY